MFGGYPPTAIGYPPTAIGYTPTAIGYTPTAIGYTPTAIGYPPAAIVGRIGHSEFFFFSIMAPPGQGLGQMDRSTRPVGGRRPASALDRAAGRRSRRRGHAVVSPQTGRQMVYVHSKLMVCDDEYLMIGSANINHRSLGGDRDTEIALGCVEAAHLKQPDGPVLPQGQVFGFRASLWGEHLGHYDPLFVKPHSLECVRRVNELAEANWEAFVGPAVRPLPHGHLLKYPYTVARDGALGAKVESFPDMAAGVMGSRPPDVLNLLTT